MFEYVKGLILGWFEQMRDPTNRPEVYEEMSYDEFLKKFAAEKEEEWENE